MDLIGERALIYFCKTPLRELDPGWANTAILPTNPLGATAGDLLQGEGRISLRQQGFRFSPFPFPRDPLPAK
jgi:hypothetical protein